MFDAPIIATANHASQPVYDYSIAIMGAGSFLGRTLSGVLADRFGVWNVFGTTSFATAIVLFGFYVACPINDAALCVGFVLYGWVSGAWLTLVSAVIAKISPVEEVGLRIGMAWTVCGPTMIVGPVIVGGKWQSGLALTTALVQSDDNRFTHAGIFCGFTFLIASFLAVGPRMIQVTTGYLRSKKGGSAV